jgi:hypothetical protein
VTTDEGFWLGCLVLSVLIVMVLTLFSGGLVAWFVIDRLSLVPLDARWSTLVILAG